MDEVEKAQDKAKDESSKASSEKEKPSSQPKLSAEAEAEVQKRVSDKLAKKGDEAKILREQLDVLLAKDKVREEAALEAAAKLHGLTVDDLKEKGYDTAEKVEVAVSLFGSTKEQAKEPSPIPDSGKSLGGTTVLKTSEVIESLDPKTNTPAEIRKKVREFEKAVEEGKVKE